MHHCIVRLLFTLFFLTCISSSAATDDSTATAPLYPTFKTSIRYFYEGDFLLGKAILHAPDSSAAGSDRVNPDMDLHHNYLGTAGSASSPQVFGFKPAPYTFILNHSYDIQMFSSEDIASYRVNKRYTELNYHTGAFKEQRISVFHTQNILKTWNAGLDFDRQSVKDFMNFSATYRSRLVLFTSYHTPNNRYFLFAHANWNLIKNDVDGGLSSDSLFDNTTVSNLGIKGLAYRISNAEEHQRKRVVYLSQYFDLGRTIRDSTGNVIKKRPSIRLHHSISLERKSFTYLDTDPDSSFYSDFYYGSITKDSSSADEMKNRFDIQLAPDTSSDKAFFRNWNSGIFAEVQNVDYRQREDSSWRNVLVGASVRLVSDSSLSFSGEGKYVIDGMDNGNYSLKAEVLSPEFVLGKFGVNAEVTLTSPDLIYRWYDSNNFIWKNNFSNLETVNLGFSYSLGKYDLEIKANHIQIENYVFMNRNAFPQQFNNFLNINQVHFIKNFHFGSWHFNNAIVYQKSDNENVIHIPQLVTDQSIYLEKFYFKKALLLATGISANFNSAYYSDAFMPANALFFIQNDTKTGGYMRFDLFINAKIKTARIFLKAENLLDDVIERSYYLTPHYPQPGRVIRFGVVWRFFDQ